MVNTNFLGYCGQVIDKYPEKFESQTPPGSEYGCAQRLIRVREKAAESLPRELGGLTSKRPFVLGGWSEVMGFTSKGVCTGAVVVEKRLRGALES